MANATISSKNIIVESSLTLDPTQLFSVEQALVLAQDYLQNFARKPDFIDKLSMVFGKEANFDFLKTEWQAGDFSVFPEIEIINAVNINGANGAFAATTNKIYLSQGFRLLRILVLYSSVTMLVLSFSLLVGYSSATATGFKGNAEAINYAAQLVFPDLFQEGNLGALTFGQQPTLVTGGVGVPADRATGFHIEGSYRVQVSNNISITPAIIYLTRPNQDRASDGGVIGVIRSSFVF